MGPKPFVLVLSMTIFVGDQLQGGLQRVLVLLEPANHLLRTLVTSEKKIIMLHKFTFFNLHDR